MKIKRNYKDCPNCKKSISLSVYKRHLNGKQCGKKPYTKYDSDQCQFCSKKISNKGSLVAHIQVCTYNPHKIKYKHSPFAGTKKGCVGWSKGLTKETDSRINKRTLSKIGKKWGASLNGHTEETKQKLSVIAKERGFGGYVKGLGCGKKGWYKGIFCDSSWELAYVIYCLDFNLNIVRNTEKRKYIWKGLHKNYIPDFIVNGVLIEIKGWSTPVWEAKLQCNPDIKVLYKKDLEYVFKYVINKYGRDFITLYNG